MATLGHIAVGMAAARWEAGRGRPALDSLFAAMTLYAGLALLPDADVVGFRLGVAYGDEWGHRGATHSLLFAAGVSLAVALLARAARRPFGRTLFVAFCVIGSHGLLDSLTDGGLGAALLWPFSNERFFAPVSPLPVAPIGRAILSARGLEVLLAEALWFAPLLLYAMFPRKASAPAAAAPG